MYCNLTVPESPVGSVEAVHNAEELAANDTDWNSYLKVVTYRCPEGSVMELPDEVNNYFRHRIIMLKFIIFVVLNCNFVQLTEQTIADTSFDVRCDADANWRPILPHNPYPEAPEMPFCIGKNVYSWFFKAKLFYN